MELENIILEGTFVYERSSRSYPQSHILLSLAQNDFTHVSSDVKLIGLFHFFLASRNLQIHKTNTIDAKQT